VVGATDLREGSEGLFGLVIGFLTPPLSMNLFVAQGISNQSLENIVKQNMPFLLVLIVVMFITMIFPDIILFLPNSLK
jgi:C4-dicarboxylate transporter DctM subunit